MDTFRFNDDESLYMDIERFINMTWSKGSVDSRDDLLQKIYSHGLQGSMVMLAQEYQDSQDYDDYDVLSMCGNVQVEYFYEIWQNFVFWCEGVLMLLVSTFGCVSNSLVVYVLTTQEIIWSSFHYLLVGLALFDLVFLAFSMTVHAFPIRGLTWLNRIYDTRQFCFLHRYVLHPFSSIAYTGGVFMTVAINIERFWAVCYPHSYRNSVISSTPLKRTIVYAIPAIFAAFLMNLPKFFEIQIIDNNGTFSCEAAELALNTTFVNWIKTSYIINAVFLTTLIPIILLIYMNTRIYYTIKKTRQNQCSTHSAQSGQLPKSGFKLQATLVIICLKFVLTHIPRLVLFIFALLESIKTAHCASLNLYYIPALYVVCLETVSNLLVHINASFNVLIYSCTSSSFTDILWQRLHCLICGTNQNSNIAERTSNPNQTVVAEKDRDNKTDKQCPSTVPSSAGASSDSGQAPTPPLKRSCLPKSQALLGSTDSDSGSLHGKMDGNQNGKKFSLSVSDLTRLRALETNGSGPKTDRGKQDVGQMSVSLQAMTPGEADERSKAAVEFVDKIQIMYELHRHVSKEVKRRQTSIWAEGCVVRAELAKTKEGGVGI